MLSLFFSKWLESSKSAKSTKSLVWELKSSSKLQSQVNSNIQIESVEPNQSFICYRTNLFYVSMRTVNGTLFHLMHHRLYFTTPSLGVEKRSILAHFVFYCVVAMFAGVTFKTFDFLLWMDYQIFVVNCHRIPCLKIRLVCRTAEKHMEWRSRIQSEVRWRREGQSVRLFFLDFFEDYKFQIGLHTSYGWVEFK